MTTPLQRIGAALQGQFSDRPPFTLVLSLYGARLNGTRPEDYYRDASLYLEGQEAVVARFAPDIVFGPFALALEAEAWGAELAWSPKAPPNVRRPLKGGAEGFLSMDPPRPGRDPRLDYLVQSLARLADRRGQERPIAGILTAPVDLPALVLGIDAWMDVLLFQPELAQGLLELSIEHFVALSRAYFAAGASFVATPVMFANPRILNRSLVESLTLPTLAKAFERAGGPVVFHHGANRIEEYLGLYRDLPGVAGFVLDEGDDLDRARAVLGPSALILGGFSGPLMEGRSPERITELSQSALRNRAADPRFILSSCAADVPWGTSPETIEAAGAAARAWASP